MLTDRSGGGPTSTVRSPDEAKRNPGQGAEEP
jgi:hypothetical protein